MKSKKKTTPVSSWKEVPECIDNRPAEFVHKLYGFSNAITGDELWVTFGDELKNDIYMAKLYFRKEKLACKSYCKGFKIEIKITEHPELPIE